MPVIEWGSCTNCGRSCAGPHGSFCSDVCRVEYNKKQSKGNATPSEPTYSGKSGKSGKSVATGGGNTTGCRKNFALLAGTVGGLGAAVGFALVKLTKAALR